MVVIFIIYFCSYVCEFTFV